MANTPNNDMVHRIELRVGRGISANTIKAVLMALAEETGESLMTYGEADLWCIGKLVVIDVEGGNKRVPNASGGSREEYIPSFSRVTFRSSEAMKQFINGKRAELSKVKKPRIKKSNKKTNAEKKVKDYGMSVNQRSKNRMEILNKRREEKNGEA